MVRRSVAGQLARVEHVPARRWGLPLHPGLLAVTLLVALGLAALRVDLIRVRYGLADALAREKALLEERRGALARVRALRDPARLAGLAEAYGLARPTGIVELPRLPRVAAPPPGAAIAAGRADASDRAPGAGAGSRGARP